MAGSNLYGLARRVSEYVRDRFMRKVRDADDVVERRSGGTKGYFESRKGFPRNPPGNRRTNPGPPPIEAPPIEPPDYRDRPPGPPPDDDYGPELGSGDIQLLGRDAGYDEDDFAAVMEGMRTTPSSSNVYGYYFERESRRTGIMYVTFLESYRGEVKTGVAGPTYAYYDVPVKKALQFNKATEASAGGAVWDYFRIRGTVSGHQHQYRLVHTSGEYVPRKATPRGFRNRAVPDLGTGPRGYRRNTLPEQIFDRGGPDRGGPDRGSPDRG